MLSPRITPGTTRRLAALLVVIHGLLAASMGLGHQLAHPPEHAACVSTAGVELTFSQEETLHGPECWVCQHLQSPHITGPDKPAPLIGLCVPDETALPPRPTPVPVRTHPPERAPPAA